MSQCLLWCLRLGDLREKGQALLLWAFSWCGFIEFRSKCLLVSLQWKLSFKDILVLRLFSAEFKHTVFNTCKYIWKWNMSEDYNKYLIRLLRLQKKECILKLHKIKYINKNLVLHEVVSLFVWGRKRQREQQLPKILSLLCKTRQITV